MRKCQCRNETLTTKRVRAFGKRVHNYMDAYLGLAAVQHQQGDDAVDDAQPEMSCSLIEKVVKKLSKPHKGHRCIMEQEHAFLDSIIVKIKQEGGKMRVVEDVRVLV